VNVLITGKPGVGKTTLILRVLTKLKRKASGFYTQEIREFGRRTGFELITLKGDSEILADVNLDSPYKVGKYKVNLKAMELACKAIEEGLKEGNLIVIDEIGKMELFSFRFQDLVLEALDSDCDVLGTIMLRPHHFTDQIKRRKDVKLYILTQGNFKEIFEKILSDFSIKNGQM